MMDVQPNFKHDQSYQDEFFSVENGDPEIRVLFSEALKKHSFKKDLGDNSTYYLVKIVGEDCPARHGDLFTITTTPDAQAGWQIIIQPHGPNFGDERAARNSDAGEYPSFNCFMFYEDQLSDDHVAAPLVRDLLNHGYWFEF
jgi:hypothetical protein